MNRWSPGGVLRLRAFALALLLGLGCVATGPTAGGPEPVLLVVLDPLSRELACACVQGFGQRNYRLLAARLESALRQRVAIEFSDDLAETLARAGANREVIIIGDRSTVAHGAQQAGLVSRPVAELTDAAGETTLAAAFIVRGGDSAQSLKDIGGRKILFGLPESDGKNSVAVAALRTAGIELPAKPERRAVYTDAALDMLDSSATPPSVAVVPAYALRLMVGCGSVRPGEMKQIATTQAVPFITVFLADAIGAEKRGKILTTLLGIKSDAKLLQALESRDGFRLLAGASLGRADDWPDWRGPARDGRVPKLPERLPSEPKIVWKKAAMTGGLAGLTVCEGRLILAERDFAEEHDLYRCLNADTGELLWLAQFPAPGKLDDGQSPRAAPVFHAGRVYLLGAFGELRCVNAATGKVLWKRHLPREFKAVLPTWGMCSPPLVVDDLLIVNPGGTNASLAALDCATGRTRWTSPGGPAAYAAFICAELGGRRQIVGYDQHSLGGWDVRTGERLWTLVPPAEGDFNVPTPIALDNGLLVATENNGTRLYRFDQAGRIVPQPVCAAAGLSPDTTTPVVTGGRVFGVSRGLHCLDLEGALRPVWQRDDAALRDHASLLADAERVLVVTMGGELLLLDARAAQCRIVSRLRLFPDDEDVYAHPALAGSRLYLRGASSVLCVDLQPGEPRQN